MKRCMANLRLSLAAVAATACCACQQAGAQVAQGASSDAGQATPTRLEVLGNYAGRLLKLQVDGKTVFEGRGHLDPPGFTWAFNILPGSALASAELTIEPCAAPFAAKLPRNGKVHAVIIQDCDVRFAFAD